MSSRVYFATAGGRFRQGPLDKLHMLFDAAGFREAISERDLVAVKVHFGERGNTSFVPPQYIRAIVEDITGCGGRPFLTDTGCLYFSARSNARDHLLVASEHGFGPLTTLAPVLIADGLRGSDVTPVRVGLKHFESVDVASAIRDASSLVVVSHVTGHGLTGFAATIKNLGMGAGGRRMKMAVHESVRPSVKHEKCEMCDACLENCPTGAITRSGGKIAILADVCFGCGECLSVCPHRAIEVRWLGDPMVAQEKLSEITYAVLENKRGRACFFSFLINITPTCDCWNYSAAPLVPDIGFMASTDPVAIDQAAADLVNRTTAATAPGDETGGETHANDRFIAVFGTDWSRQLQHAEELGLGTRKYELVRVGD